MRIDTEKLIDLADNRHLDAADVVPQLCIDMAAMIACLSRRDRMAICSILDSQFADCRERLDGMGDNHPNFRRELMIGHLTAAVCRAIDDLKARP